MKKIKEKELYSAINMIGKEREFKQVLYALLTKEHVLINGIHGTGKSMFAKNVFSLINNSSHYDIHMTKFMSEEVVFGPINIKKLREESIIEYETKHGALTKNFLFLDEFFDASDALLRSLLGLLNERKWQKGHQQVSSPLHTAICTSNYKRENEVTAALLDRFIFKMEFKPLNKKLLPILLEIKEKDIPHLLSIKELEAFYDKIKDANTIEIPKAISDKLIDIKNGFEKLTKKYISDRTFLKLNKLIRASALLNGRETATEEDLKETSYVLCTLNNKTEEDFFDTIFQKTIKKERAIVDVSKSLEEIEKATKDIDKSLKAATSDKEFIKKMQEFNSYLSLLVETSPPNKELETKKTELVKRIKKVFEENKERFIIKHSQ